MPRKLLSGFVMAPSVSLGHDEIRAAADAGDIPFSEDLVEAVNGALQMAVLWLTAEAEAPTVQAVRKELNRITRSVGNAAGELRDLIAAEGRAAEAVRFDVKVAIDLVELDGLGSLTHKLEALHAALKRTGESLMGKKGRPKALERYLIGPLCRIFEAAGGRTTLTYDDVTEQVSGPCLDFITAILNSPQLGPLLPEKRANIVMLIRDWRASDIVADIRVIPAEKPGEGEK